MTASSHSNVIVNDLHRAATQRALSSMKIYGWGIAGSADRPRARYHRRYRARPRCASGEEIDEDDDEDD